MIETIKKLYFRLTLDHAAISLILVLALIAGLSYFIDRFRLDASADSLVLEDDADLKYYRSIRANYPADDFLFVTYSPLHGKDILSDEILNDIKSLRDELRTMDRVESVVSLLDVPLIDSPRMTLSEIQKQIRTLETPGTDRELARKEFLSSPLYTNLIMSPSGKTTALQVNFKPNVKLTNLLNERNALREKLRAKTISKEERAKLETVLQQYTAATEEQSNFRDEDIASVRAILDKHRDYAKIFLGGVPMIVSDMINFIRSDIEVFGAAVLTFIILLLSIAFKRPRWVLIPVIICGAVCVGMIGFLGMMQWQVTVVSSNFVSLLLIITLSLTVHMIVRYQELQTDDPDMSQSDLLKETLRSKTIPSFYTTITTMVAFASLIISGIRPVIDFGWMMLYGVGFSLVMALVLFPALLAYLKPGRPMSRTVDLTGHATAFFANMVSHNPKKTLAVFSLVLVAAIYGISTLTVENRFIDYFKPTTEIYKGMLVIDQELGGTTPLEIILDPDKEFKESQAEMAEFQDDFSTDSSAGLSGSSFWFNVFELENVTKAHDYLDQQSSIGKVLSMSSTMKMLTMLNNDDPMDNLSLSVMYKRLPEEVKKTLFDPYMSPDGNQMRIAVRVIDSDKKLLRNDLLKKIRHDFTNDLSFKDEQVHLTGMVVLYNNMLQSLFRSQILTIGVVFLAILGMFIVLFRSLYLSIIAIIPNIVSAATVLGLIGLLGIPLDIMTITIAAITIGIAVDNTIHYISRFKEEFPIDRDYWATVKRCHQSIGRAVYYTSITITFGFSILALSNFIPTIYFGLFTGFAMLVAMFANLTLLPVLLGVLKPMGKPAAAVATA